MNNGDNLMTETSTLIDVLVKRQGAHFACGWLSSVINSLPGDLDLTQKQRKALERVITQNIKWASEE